MGRPLEVELGITAPLILDQIADAGFEVTRAQGEAIVILQADVHHINRLRARSYLTPSAGDRARGLVVQRLAKVLNSDAER